MKRTQGIWVFLLIVFYTINLQGQEFYTQSNAASIGNETGTTTGWSSNGPPSVDVINDTDGASDYSIVVLRGSGGSYSDGQTTVSGLTQGIAYTVVIRARNDSDNSNPGYFNSWTGIETAVDQNVTTNTYQDYVFSIVTTGTSINIRAWGSRGSRLADRIYISSISVRPANQQGDTQAPTAPTVSHAGQTHNTVNLSWPNASDNVGVTGYRVFKNGVLEADFGPFTSYQVTGLNPQNYYEFTVKAVDAAGNESEASNIIAVTTDDPPSTTDTEAPTAPTLSSSNQTDTGINLSWTGATDNTAVTGYKVYNGLNVEATLGNVSSYQVTGLNTETNYTFTVRAVDAAGNESPNSNTVNVSASTATVGDGTTGNWLRDGDNISYSEGNVGVGTTTPVGPLHVKSTLNNILSLQTEDNGEMYTNWIDKDGVTRARMGFTTNMNRFRFQALNGTNESMLFEAGSFSFTGPVLSQGDVGSHGTAGPKIGLHSNEQGTYGLMGFAHGKIGDGNLYMIVRNKNTNNGSWISLGQRDSDTDKGDIKLIAGYFDNFDMRGKIKFSVGGSEKVDVIINEHGNMGIGTTNPDSKLTVKGKIHAEEVKIDLAVPAPDYVFKENYSLKTLEEVRQYIEQFGHLPNIPSAAIMEADGVELGIMNMKLLEKIEELTLYLIAQENKIKILENQSRLLEQLQKRLDDLEKKK